MEDQIVKGQWHVKKEVTIGHIFTTLTVVTGMIFYASKIENRLNLAELRIDQIESYNKYAQSRLDAQFSKLDTTLIRIEDKLDRKMDKKYGQ